MLRNTILAAAATALFAAPATGGDSPILGHELFGSGPEKVIVFHDWMSDATNYDTVRPWLDTGTYTYAFVEVRGYGASKGLTGNYTSDEIAGDTLRLAEHLGWEKFHLVGHSMNGMAGFKTLLLDWHGAHRIKSYVAVTPVTPDGYPASDEERAFLAAAITDDETARNAFGALTNGKLNGAWAARKTNLSRASSRPQALRGYYAMWLDEDFSAELAAANVDTPVLVIGGRNDLPGFQEAYYSKTLAKWLPNIHFEYIDNAGHYPMQETPVLFATLVEAHLNANK
ncbi:alpha/beta fold hydrolase [Ciceribacter sp. RN22]|uniref:alpha/beta fold hydrolase n=1 Tax=Ciceribacter sp. RN22 TaxID=2954932 RepID=UPI0020932087|nr:alpha/beta hydrolase [Ciceribacter sp. RN22]MCO6179651.1 alpha/beta hydrolase [Ciceribacter sp. RN22]